MPAPYRSVETSIWDHPWFRTLSPTAKLVVFHLLTGPSTTQIPGLFRAGQGQLAEECQLPLTTWQEAFHEAFPEALGEAFRQDGAKVRVKADWKARLVWVTGACRPSNRPLNPNQVRGWRKVVKEYLPECDLLWEALAGLRDRVLELVDDREAFDKAFLEAFPEAFTQGFPATENLEPRTKNRTPPPPSSPAKRGRAAKPEAEEEVLERPDGGEEGWSDAQLRRPLGMWSFIQEARKRKELPLERRRPRAFDDWLGGALDEGITPRELTTALASYHLDEDFALKGWPTAVFITDGVWRVRTGARSPERR